MLPTDGKEAGRLGTGIGGRMESGRLGDTKAGKVAARSEGWR